MFGTMTVKATIASACILLVGAAPSAAEPEKARDPSHDVVSTPYDSDRPLRPEPTREAGDILRTRVSLGTELVVTTKYRSLRAGRAEQDFSWFIRTSEEDSPWVAIAFVPPSPGQEYFVLASEDGTHPECGRADIRRTARTVTLSVSAACLGDPSWVRVGNGAATAVEGKRTYADDARRDGAPGVGPFWKFGPRVSPSTTSAAPGSASPRS